MPIAIAIAAAALATFAALGVYALIPYISTAWEGSRRFSKHVFLAGVALSALYGGSKHIHPCGKVEYPFTDIENRYLTDRGSFVTNDFVRIDFSRIIAPSDAPLFIDIRRLDQTNDVDWVNWITTTFDAFDVPQDIPFPAASNYNFCVYTTWVPPPAVHTNGVVNIFWQKDIAGRGFVVPMRTVIYVNNDKIIPREISSNTVNRVFNPSRLDVEGSAEQQEE